MNQHSCRAGLRCRFFSEAVVSCNSDVGVACTHNHVSLCDRCAHSDVGAGKTHNSACTSSLSSPSGVIFICLRDAVRPALLIHNALLNIEDPHVTAPRRCSALFTCTTFQICSSISLFSHYFTVRTPFATQCWCGASDVDYAINGMGTCDMACAGDDTETCGGFFAFNLYNVPTAAPTPAPTPAPTLYPVPTGCFRDLRDDRVMTNMMTSSTMTPLVCAAHCASYPFFGTQYGTEVSDPESPYGHIATVLTRSVSHAV